MEFEDIERIEMALIIENIQDDIQSIKSDIEGKRQHLLANLIIIPEDYDTLKEMQDSFSNEMAAFIDNAGQNVDVIKHKISQLKEDFGAEESLIEALHNRLETVETSIADFTNFSKDFYAFNFVDYRSEFTSYEPPIEDFESFKLTRDFVFKGKGEIDYLPMWSIYKSLIFKVSIDDKRNELFDSFDRITKFLLKTNLYTAKKLDEYMQKEFKKVLLEGE